MKIKIPKSMPYNLDPDMFLGEKPNNCEWIMDGKEFARKCDLCCPEQANCHWVTTWGGALMTQYRKIIHGQFAINHKITLYIAGDKLRIFENRMNGKPDVWEWVSDEGISTQKFFTRYHVLEDEKCIKYLNADGDSLYWKIFQERAKEIYERNHVR